MKNLSNQPRLLPAVVPARNAGYHIDEAPQTLLDQTERFYQVIVVDDGRTDRIQLRLVWYAHHDTVHILHGVHAGSELARNEGLLHASIAPVSSELLFLLKHLNHVPWVDLFRAITTSCIKARICQTGCSSFDGRRPPARFVVPAARHKESV